MGKKTRKTRWRTLSISGPQSDCEESSSHETKYYGNTNGSGNYQHRPSRGETRTNGHGGQYYQQNGGKYWNGHTSSQSTPTRHVYTRSNSSYEPTRQSTRSNSTASGDKITFNEDEYTRITTPRQDVLFKKGYLSKPKPYLQQQKSNGSNSTGGSTGNGTPDHHSADGTESTESVEYEQNPFMYPNGFIDHNGICYFNGVPGFEPFPGFIVYNTGPPVCYPPYVPNRVKRYSTDSMTESTSPNTEAQEQYTDGEALTNGQSQEFSNQPVYNYMYPGYVYGNGQMYQQPEIVQNDVHSNDPRKLKKKRKRRKLSRSKPPNEETSNGYSDEEYSSDEEIVSQPEDNIDQSNTSKEELITNNNKKESLPLLNGHSEKLDDQPTPDETNDKQSDTVLNKNDIKTSSSEHLSHSSLSENSDTNTDLSTEHAQNLVVDNKTVPTDQTETDNVNKPDATVELVDSHDDSNKLDNLSNSDKTLQTDVVIAQDKPKYRVDAEEFVPRAYRHNYDNQITLTNFVPLPIIGDIYPATFPNPPFMPPLNFIPGIVQNDKFIPNFIPNQYYVNQEQYYLRNQQNRETPEDEKNETESTESNDKPIDIAKIVNNPEENMEDNTEKSPVNKNKKTEYKNVTSPRKIVDKKNKKRSNEPKISTENEQETTEMDEKVETKNDKEVVRNGTTAEIETVKNVEEVVTNGDVTRCDVTRNGKEIIRNGRGVSRKEIPRYGKEILRNGNDDIRNGKDLRNGNGMRYENDDIKNGKEIIRNGKEVIRNEAVIKIENEVIRIEKEVLRNEREVVRNGRDVRIEREFIRNERDVTKSEKPEKEVTNASVQTKFETTSPEKTRVEPTFSKMLKSSISMIETKTGDFKPTYKKQTSLNGSTRSPNKTDNRNYSDSVKKTNRPNATCPRYRRSSSEIKNTNVKVEANRVEAKQPVSIDSWINVSRKKRKNKSVVETLENFENVDNVDDSLVLEPSIEVCVAEIEKTYQLQAQQIKTDETPNITDDKKIYDDKTDDNKTDDNDIKSNESTKDDDMKNNKTDESINEVMKTDGVGLNPRTVDEVVSVKKQKKVEKSKIKPNKNKRIIINDKEIQKINETFNENKMEVMKNKIETIPKNKMEVIRNKIETIPLHQMEIPVNKTETIPVNKIETITVNKTETIPVNKMETIQATETIQVMETLPVNKTETIPVNKMETVVVNKTEEGNKIDVLSEEKIEVTSEDKTEAMLQLDGNKMVDTSEKMVDVLGNKTDAFEGKVDVIVNKIEDGSGDNIEVMSNKMEDGLVDNKEMSEVLSVNKNEVPMCDNNFEVMSKNVDISNNDALMKEEVKTEVVKSKKKKRKNKVKSSPNQDESFDFLIESNLTDPDSKTNVEVSLEIDRMIQRGLYANLEEKLKSFNPSDSFIKSGVPDDFSFDLGSNAFKVDKLKNFDFNGVLFNTTINKTLEKVMLYKNDEKKTSTDNVEDDKTEVPTGNLQITRAVKEWMNKTRENTPEVELLKSVDEIKNEYLICNDIDSEEDESEVPKNVEGLPVPVQSANGYVNGFRTRESSCETTPDLLECWESDIEIKNYDNKPVEYDKKKFFNNDVQKKLLVPDLSNVEEGEDVLEIYESVYGKNEDFLRIQKEIENQKTETKSLNYPKSGGLPYRAICCNVM